MKYLTHGVLISEKAVKEDPTIVAEHSHEISSSKSASDAFDEAAAAPIGPSFPFFNKTERHEPKVSSWGFQHITINSTAPSISVQSPSKSPDNELFNENSDDFVFASKLSRSKEENKLKSQQNALKIDVNGNINNENLPKSNNSINNNQLNGQLGDTNSEFQPVLGASTPLTSKNDSFPTIFKNIINTTTTVIEEELSGFAPVPKDKREVNKVHKEVCKTIKDKKEICKPSKEKKDIPKISKDKKDVSKVSTDKKDVPKTLKCIKDILKPVKEEKESSKPVAPLISNGIKEEHDHLQLNFNSSDSLLKEANHIMSPVSPASPVKDLSEDMKYTPPVTPNTPPNKRRKLDKPSNSPISNSILLKDRPDLIRDFIVKAPRKPECKLITVKRAKKNKTSELHKQGEDNHKKVKKKKPVPKLAVNHPAVIKLSSNSIEKDLDKKLSEPVVETKPLINYVEPINNKVSPISISLNKTVDRTQSSLESVHKYEIMSNSKADIFRKKSVDSNKVNSVPPLKLTVKAPSISKIKSKTFIDSDDDCSSLSSDSLDGFESLIPKKANKESTNDNKKTFKTKAELKNPCPSLSTSLVATISSVTDKKKAKQSTTKIKIAKTSPMNAALTCNSKPSMKLKFPIPKSEPISPSVNVDAKKESSLQGDDHFYVFNPLLVKAEPLQTKSSLKIPKIKIKIASSHLTDANTTQSDSKDTKKAPISKAIPNNAPSPENVLKPLKLKLSEARIQPVAPKSPKTVKNKVVKQKPVKAKKESKEPKQKQPKMIKIKTVVKVRTKVQFNCHYFPLVNVLLDNCTV